MRLIKPMILALLQSASLFAREEPGPYKYVDTTGNVVIVESRENAPEIYRSEEHWGAAVDPECDCYTQSVKTLDLDGDGKQEFLVSIVASLPTGRTYEILEAYKDCSGGFIKLVVVNASRGDTVTYLDINGDKRYEFYGPKHGENDELWIWYDGEYVDIGDRMQPGVWQKRLNETGLRDAFRERYVEWRRRRF